MGGLQQTTGSRQESRVEQSERFVVVQECLTLERIGERRCLSYAAYRFPLGRLGQQSSAEQRPSSEARLWFLALSSWQTPSDHPRCCLHSPFMLHSSEARKLF